MTDRFKAFVTGITVCYKAIRRIKSAEMTELGLKGAHVMCLFFLSREPEGLTAAELCQLCAEDKAAVSRTVADLQSRGFLRAEGGRYRARLLLTESGTAAALQVDRLIEQWVETGSRGLTPEDREAFYRALAIISENLTEHTD